MQSINVQIFTNINRPVLKTCGVLMKMLHRELQSLLAVNKTTTFDPLLSLLLLRIKQRCGSKI